jgi:hypothetical protein
MAGWIALMPTISNMKLQRRKSEGSRLLAGLAGMECSLHANVLGGCELSNEAKWNVRKVTL